MDIGDSVELARRVKPMGVDLIDCFFGRKFARTEDRHGPGVPVPFAERVRAEAEIATGAVGLITTAEQAERECRSEKGGYSSSGARVPSRSLYFRCTRRGRWGRSWIRRRSMRRRSRKTNSKNWPPMNADEHG